jgi:hypothetical protein
MANWLPDGHFTLGKFTAADVQQLNWESFASKTIVGTPFHRRCLENRDKLRRQAKGGGVYRIPNGERYPPLAISIDYVAQRGDLGVVESAMHDRQKHGRKARQLAQDAMKNDINSAKKGRDTTFGEKSKNGTVCGLCSKGASETCKLQKCGKCKSEFYCCAEHQKQHWPAHKAICRKITAAMPHALFFMGPFLSFLPSLTPSFLASFNIPFFFPSFHPSFLPPSLPFLLPL